MVSPNVTEPIYRVIYVIYNNKMMKPEDFLRLFDPGSCFIFPVKENITINVRQKKHNLHILDRSFTLLNSD